MWAFELTMTTSASDTINSLGNNPHFSYELFSQRCRSGRWINVQGVQQSWRLNLILLYNHGENSFRHVERRAVILYIKLVAWEWNFRRTELVRLTVWQWFWHCGSRTPRSVDISNHIFTLDVSCMVQTGCRLCVAPEARVKSHTI
jgi:hypothetical protein